MKIIIPIASFIFGVTIAVAFGANGGISIPDSGVMVMQTGFGNYEKFAITPADENGVHRWIVKCEQ